jgi:hypothetical protein
VDIGLLDAGSGRKSQERFKYSVYDTYVHAILEL